MKTTRTALHAGTNFIPPHVDKWAPPRGEVTWVHAVTNAVSSSGPSVALTVDFRVPRAAGREQIVVLRVQDMGGYLPTGHDAFTDPEGNLAVSAVVTVPMGDAVQEMTVPIPYLAFPDNAGGLVEIEVTVHDPTGPISALGYYSVELPEDVDRSPDLLTVLAHTLVHLFRMKGALTREAVRPLRRMLVDNFELDALGDFALRRILKTANQVEHDVDTLAEVVSLVVEDAHRKRFVNVVYATLRNEGRITDPQQAFIDALLAKTSIHDHQKFGPQGLNVFWNELELPPGSDFKTAKDQWRSLVRDYHPDRVQHLAPGFIEFATEKVKRLNEAWARIKDAIEAEGAPVQVQVQVDLDDL